MVAKGAVGCSQEKWPKCTHELYGYGYGYGYESQRPDGGLNCNLGARALLLMRGLGSALELLRTSRSDDQQRATRVGLATNGAQRHAHELAHAPSESGARHSRDLRGGPREGT